MSQATATIYRPAFGRTWSIDLLVDGQVWKSWGYNFKTRKAAIAHCLAVGNIQIAEAA